MRQPRLTLCRASAGDFGAVIGLIEGARRWLRTKNTDQWLQPWPSEEDRGHRIREALQAGKTWIVWDGHTAAATITAQSEDNGVWSKQMLADPAVYISRLVVSRSYSGQGLGARLLDWAAVRARHEYGARWIRVDVWTTNTALHGYYVQRGFEHCGFCESIAGYPSAALFQKPTDEVLEPDSPPFRVIGCRGGGAHRPPGS